MKTNLFLSLMLALCLFACDRKELPILPHDPGQVITSSVELGPDYRWQFFFDLETHQVVGLNLKTDWDLGFEATANGYRIVLNTSKAMYAWPTGETNMEAVMDTAGFASGKRLDQPSGNLDSTAIGDWRGSQEVYVVDRGYSASGQHQGFRKVQILAVDASKYSLSYAALDGSGDSLIHIPKDSAYNLSFFSFAAGGKVVAIEPPKQDWDLCLTQYMEILPEPYLVTGVLLNRHQTTAVMDSSLDFDVIDFDAASSIPRSSALNTIGYAWKYYNFGSATYYVLPQMNYIIQDNKGLLYKLHFVDFYNGQGIKGSPKWEYQLL